MNPEGSNYQDIGDFQSAYSDYCVAPESAEFANTPFRKSTAVIDEKHGAGSNSAIHEILKCPACVNLMYSPIYERNPHFWEPLHCAGQQCNGQCDASGTNAIGIATCRYSIELLF
ncbi:hypothetical protein T459_01649 [Capsicum annuum]|uniref:Uncharacterized protein n=1 Tax=Capsicum annuum TaxID=4072 RepID=A0A2G3AHR0_CAPAN|nr:hypothetical protein T459_01649 [Capsicum annuum]